MSKSTALAVLLPEQKPDELAAILIAYGTAEEVHHRLKLLYQGAQGACLLKLQQEYGFSRGGDRTKPTGCGFATWEKFLEGKFGFSDEKARRLMNRWKSVSPLIEKLPPAQRQLVADFLRRPMLHLTPAEVKALEKVTNKITTLQEEIEALEECKFIKQRHGASLKNRAAGTAGDDDSPPPLTLEARVQGQLDLFGKFALAVDEVVDRGGKKVHIIAEWPTLKLDEAIVVAKNTLKTLVKVRQARK
jgi:hypothetical protein